MSSPFGLKNIIIGMSLRKDGNMRLSELENNAEKNRESFFINQGIEARKVVFANLVHGSQVRVVRRSDRGKIMPAGDALITGDLGVVLALTVADCLPVYFYDLNKKVVAIAHAGWRSLKAGVINKVIAEFLTKFDSEVQDIMIQVGPHIQACHFEVKEDVAKEFSEYPDQIINKAGKRYINLAGVVVEQLVKLGLKREQIKISPDCTYCLSDKYFSYRRDRSEGLKTMLVYIGMRDK